MADLERQTSDTTVHTGTAGRRRGGSIALKMLADRSLQFFSTRAEALFDQVGEVFFDLVESSEEDDDQGKYIDAIRIIREERAAISGRWLNAISSAFDTVGSDPAGGDVAQKGAVEPGADPTRVALEESLSLDSMIASAANNCHEFLTTLRQRISRLLDTNVSPRSLPLSPERLSSQFVRAMDGCRLDSQARLVLLGEYEKLVLASLPELLEQSDQLLASLGIAAVDNPRPRYEPEAAASAVGPRTANGGGSARAERYSEAGGGTPSADTSAEPAQGYVSRPSAVRRERPSPGYAKSEHAKPEPAKPEPAKPGTRERKADRFDNSGGPLLLSRPALCELLEQVAEEQAGRARDTGGSSDPVPDTDVVMEPVELMISQLLSRDDGDTLELGERDQSVIHLVDALFAYLLEDMALPATLVRLLMRTALPFARAALADASVLEAHHHPARRLLAEIVQCAEELREVKNIEADSLYRCLATAVACFEDAPLNARALSGGLLQLVREVERERELARAMDATLVEGAIEKEKVDAARSQVEELLESRLLGKQFGYALVTFVEQVWAEVLFNTLAGDEPESGRWLGAVDLLDQLLGLEAEAGPESIDRVLGALAQRLMDEGWDTADIFRWRERIGNYLLRGKLRPENIHPLILEKIDAFEARDYSLRVLVDTIDTNLPGEFDQEARELAARLDDSVLAEIDSLKQGCWVRTVDPDSRAHRYWRFVGLVGASEKLLFSDRRGQRTFLATRFSLAAQLKYGELLVSDNPRRFENCLSRAVRDHGPVARRLARPGELANSGGLRA